MLPNMRVCFLCLCKGYFLVLPTRSYQAGYRAIFRSPLFRRPATPMCQFSLWYYMVAFRFDTLQVALRADGRVTKLFERVGSQQSNWLPATMTVTVQYSREFTVSSPLLFYPKQFKLFRCWRVFISLLDCFAFVVCKFAEEMPE